MAQQQKLVGIGALHRPRMSRGLVGCWLTDDSDPAIAPDHSGRLNAGTITGAVWTAGRGRALDFDGLDDFVSLGNGASLNLTTAISIEAWILTGVPYRTIATKNNWDANERGWALRNDFFSVFETKTQSYPGVRVVYGSLVPWNGSWHQITGTWKGGEAPKGYIDGALVAQGATACTHMDSVAANVRLANPNMAGNEFFSGLIGEIRIWNRALSATEIRDLYFSRRVKYGV